MSARVLAAVQSPPPPPPALASLSRAKKRDIDRGGEQSLVTRCKNRKKEYSCSFSLFRRRYTRGDWDRAVDSCWREKGEEEEEKVTFFINVTV